MLVEHNNIGVVAEVQFLLEWLLMAKQLGHSLYGYKRNREFVYQSLDNISENSSKNDKVNSSSNNVVRVSYEEEKQSQHDKIESRLRSIISFQDYSKFSHEMLVLTRESELENELKGVSNDNVDDDEIKKSNGKVDVPYLFSFRFNNGNSLLTVLFKNNWMQAMKLYHATVMYFDQIYGDIDNSITSHEIDNIIAKQNSIYHENGSQWLNDFVNDESFWKYILNNSKDVDKWKIDGRLRFVAVLANSPFLKTSAEEIRIRLGVDSNFQKQVELSFKPASMS